MKVTVDTWLVYNPEIGETTSNCEGKKIRQ